MDKHNIQRREETIPNDLPRFCGLFIGNGQSQCQNIATYTIRYKNGGKLSLCDYHLGLVIGFMSQQEWEGYTQ